MPAFKPAVEPSAEETSLSTITHIVALVCTSFLVGGIIVPLIMRAYNKDSQFVRAHANECFNFQMTMFIAALISIPLCFVLVGFVTLFIIAVLTLVLPIIAAVKASNGMLYRYPLTIHFLRG